MHYVSLVKVHESTRQNSLDKAADLLYSIMFSATALPQSLLLVPFALGIVLPVEKMLVPGVTVSDYYNPFASVVHTLIYVLLCTECIAQPRKVHEVA